MKQKMVLFFIAILCSNRASFARSIHRPHDPSIPQITFYWKNKPAEKHVLRMSHLEEFPYFKTFNKDSFEKYILPDSLFIPSQRKGASSISTEQIKKLVDNVIPEITQNRKSYTDFDTIKSEDFNFTNHCGALILKFKNYPLILKLFFEYPKSMIEPLNKGIIPCFHFYMSGGGNRHFTGFTRLRNRELIAEQLPRFPQWKDRIKLPRKWLYIPRGAEWISIEGMNMANKKFLYNEIPGTYAIIADEIIAERVFSLANKEDKEIALQLTDDLQTIIDPNISNFRIEQRTGKIALIDTEHFPSLVGLRESRKYRSYTDYYFSLATKYIVDSMFRSKKSRKMIQTAKNDFATHYFNGDRVR